MTSEQKKNIKRLIKLRKKAKQRLMDYDSKLEKAFQMAIDEKADVVEVVRCKDCKYCFDAKMGGMWCEHPDNIMPLGSNPCDFCSYGERKEKDNG